MSTIKELHELLQVAIACGMLDDLKQYCENPASIGDVVNAVERMAVASEQVLVSDVAAPHSPGEGDLWSTLHGYFICTGGKVVGPLKEPTLQAKTHCSECGAQQFHTPGGLSCPNGHGGAYSVEERGRHSKLPCRKCKGTEVYVVEINDYPDLRVTCHSCGYSYCEDGPDG